MRLRTVFEHDMHGWRWFIFEGDSCLAWSVKEGMSEMVARDDARQMRRELST